jgi:hypothetical protein
MLIEGLDIMLGPERQKVQLKEAPKEDEEGGVCVWGCQSRGHTTEA